jgi:hypothetical protein
LAAGTTLDAQPARQDRLPAPIVSIGFGGLIPYENPERPNRDLTASTQIPITPLVALEGEVLRSIGQSTISGIFDARTDRPYFPVSRWETNHEALNISVNVLFRKDWTRTAGYVGGGIGGHRSVDRMTLFTSCHPRVAGGCDDRPDTVTHREWRSRGPSWQIVGGLDFAIAPRLAVFGAARWLTAEDVGLGAAAGIRIALGRGNEKGRRESAGPAFALTRSGEAGSSRVRLLEADSVRRCPSHISADERCRICPGLRSELLRTPDVHVGGIEVPVAVYMELVDAPDPPGKAPNVPHEYSSRPVKSYLRNFCVMPSATQRC